MKKLRILYTVALVCAIVACKSYLSLCTGYIVTEGGMTNWFTNADLDFYRMDPESHFPEEIIIISYKGERRLIQYIKPHDVTVIHIERGTNGGRAHKDE